MAPVISPAEFLLDRIHELAEEAFWMHGEDCDTHNATAIGGFPCDCPWPKIIEDDCDAKRLIVEEHRMVHFTDVDLRLNNVEVCLVCHKYMDVPDWITDDADEWHYPLVQAGWPCTTIRALLQPYAGRPDFREEWKL